MEITLNDQSLFHFRQNVDFHFVLPLRYIVESAVPVNQLN